MGPAAFLLAQQQRDLGPYLVWLGLMLGAVTIAGVIILVYRARVLGKEASSAPAGALEELRRLRDRGEISPDEYDAAKMALAAKITGKPVSKPPAAPAPRPAPTRPSRPPGGDRVAPPGFDLTGQPLPPQRDPRNE